MAGSNPAVKIVLVVVCLAAAGFIIMSRGGGESSNYTHFVYDLDTGELLPSDHRGPFPATLDNGHQIVRAVVFACGDCANNQFIGMLERMPQEARDAFNANNPSAPGAVTTEIALPVEDEPLQWYVTGSPQSGQISNFARQRCGSERVVTCRP